MLFFEGLLPSVATRTDCPNDLVLVTEFAVVLREADLRAPPAPLT